MKIWILSCEEPHLQAGGIARYVDTFARVAADQGEEITVIYPGSAEKEKSPRSRYQLVEFETRESRVSTDAGNCEPDEHPAWPYNNMTPFASRSYRFADVVIDRIRKGGAPDVIECQDYAAVGYFLMQRKLCGEELLQDIPIILHLHTPDFIVQELNQYPRFKLPDYWIGRMERACIWMADRVIRPSHFLAEEIQKYIEGERRDIEVIPYPHSATPEEGAEIQPVPGKLLYTGRIELRKGVEELLLACRQLWDEGAEFTLEMAGGDVHTPLRGGSLRKHLETRYSDDIDNGRLRIHGPMDHEDCLNLVRSSHAVIVPSLWENFPNTCMEAMLLKKPVVIADHGGQVEMLGTDERAGLSFSHGDPGGLKAALVKALSLSKQEARSMGDNARQRISDLCDPKVITESRLKHFNTVKNNQQVRSIYPFSNQQLRESPSADPLPENPLVTVVIPFYNLGRFLPECVDSVLLSTGVNFEILIVNDGSTDPQSLQVLDGLRKQGEAKIRILDLPNGGLAKARNTGVAEARGELIAFVDADDKIEPGFLQRAVGILKRYPNVHIAYSWIRFFDGGKGIWHSWTFDLPYLLCHNQLIPIAVVRRDSFLKHGRNKSHIVYGLEDFEGWISMAEAGCGGVAIPETLVGYRIRSDSMFKAIEPDKKLYLYDLISAEHPNLYARYGLELFNLQNANGPAYGWDQPTMFSAPQDRLIRRLQRAEDELPKIEKENHLLREAEAWYRKTFSRQLENLEGKED